MKASSEETLLLLTQKKDDDDNNKAASNYKGLSVVFTIICIVDVFGVFPVVALPKVIIDCGYYGIIVVVVVCSMQIYTAILLGKCWIIAEHISPIIHRKKRYPYSALAELTFGKTLSKFVTVLLDVTVFSGGIPNLIVASQNLELLGLRLSGETFDVSYCSWIIVLGTILCPILWLGSPKDMKLLCTISVGIVVAVFLLICGCIVATDTENETKSDEFLGDGRPIWQLLMSAYGIIAFQFDIHPTILTIQVDMKEKNKLTQAIYGGFFVSLGMFVVITSCAAIKFGTATAPSILSTLPSSIPLHLAAALVALQLCLTSAISNSALYQHVEDCMEISRRFNYRRCLLRTILTILGIVIAESVPRFDLVMSLIGGTLTGPLVFILPPLFYLRMLHLENKFKLTSGNFKNDDDKETAGRPIFMIFCVLFIAVAVCATIFTTYLNVVNVVHYSNFSEPCIYNVSSAIINF